MSDLVKWLRQSAFDAAMAGHGSAERYDEAADEIELLIDLVAKREDLCGKLTKQLTSAKEALGWYAKDYDHAGAFSMWDGGAKARATLHSLSDENGK